MTSIFALYEAISVRPDLCYPPLRRFGRGQRGWDRTELLPTIDPPHRDLPRPQESIQQHFRGLRRGQRPLRCHATADFLMQPFNDISRPSTLPLRRREAIEGEQLLARFAQ